jgi:hypothetical protein
MTVRRDQERTQAEIHRLLPAAEVPEDRIAYETASKRLAYLEEPVTEECVGFDGSPYVATHPRWLSDAFRREHGGYGRRIVDAADAAVKATARGKLEVLQQSLSVQLEKEASIRRNFVVGTSRVYRWSMSEAAAERAAAAARRLYPMCCVVVSTEIGVLDKKPRKPQTGTP